MSIRLPLFVAGALLTCSATAADWPTFRGPNRDGKSTETGLLKTWPKDGPPVVWTAKNLGLGFGTPTIADGKIFGMGTRDGKDGIWALKEADGSELWFTPFDEPRKTNQNNGPSGSPTFDAGKLYTMSSNGKLVCMDAASGKQVWGVDLVAAYNGSVQAWGYTETPTIDGDKVICTPGSAKAVMLALNKADGKEIWKTELPGGTGNGGGYSSAVKAVIGNVPMYVMLLGKSGGVIGVHADTGKLLWQYKEAGFGGVAQVSMPIVKGDRVWFSTAYGGGAGLLQIVPGADGTFTVKALKTYTGKQLQNHHGGMILVGDYIYFGHDQNDGKPVCVDMNTGEIKWGPVDNPPGVQGRASAAVLFADGLLYFRYQSGMLVLIDPSLEGLKVVSSFKLPPPNVANASQSWPHPVIANGKLYIRDQNLLYCYNVKATTN